MKKWRIDWSTYDCGSEIIEAETRDEAVQKFRDMTFDEICSDREPYGEIQNVREVLE